MKANELRVGNYLQRGVGSVITVKRLIQNDDDILVNEALGLFTLGYTALPIPLTEEILLKCGYVPLNESSAGVRYGHVVNGVFDAGLSFIFWKDSQELICVIKHIKYLHQLQNLYFALTEQELDIKQMKE